MNNLVHEEDYVNEWGRLRDIIDFVMCELQKTSLEAHNNAQNTLNDWFKDVVNSMKEVEIKRNQEKSKLYLSDTPIFLDASGILSSGVEFEILDLRWLTKLKIQADAPILEKLKSDSVTEKENKELKKALLEQRLFVDELQRKIIAQQEEAKIREENLVKSYTELKEDMQNQSEIINSLILDLMEMVQKQAKP